MSAESGETAEESTQDRPRTRTRKRTEVNVEKTEVEEEEYLCPNCNQWFEDDDIIPIGLAVERDDADIDIEDVDQLCEQCTETIFGSVPESSALDLLNEDLKYWDGRDFAVAAVSLFGTVAVAGVLAFVVVEVTTVFVTAFSDLTETLFTVTEAPTEEVGTEVSGPLGYVFPLFGFLVAGWLLTKLGRSGGR